MDNGDGLPYGFISIIYPNRKIINDFRDFAAKKKKKCHSEWQRDRWILAIFVFSRSSFFKNLFRRCRLFGRSIKPKNTLISLHTNTYGLLAEDSYGLPKCLLSPASITATSSRIGYTPLPRVVGSHIPIHDDNSALTTTPPEVYSACPFMRSYFMNIRHRNHLASFQRYPFRTGMWS